MLKRSHVLGRVRICGLADNLEKKVFKNPHFIYTERNPNRLSKAGPNTFCCGEGKGGLED